MHQATALVILLTVVAGAGGCDSNVVEAAARNNIEPGSDPGYSLKNAEIIETDSQGKPRYTVNAQHAQQDPTSGEIELQTIRMRLRDQRGSEWRLQAKSGRMPEDASTVELRGQVVVEGAPSKGSEEMKLRTEELDVDTRSERVSTAAPVSITMSGRLLTARGMKADLKDRRLQLESEVHGRFKP